MIGALRRGGKHGFLAISAGILLFAANAAAKTLDVMVGDDSLRKAVASAGSHDILKLEAGVHDGPIAIDKPLTLEGEAGAIIDGKGQGRVIEVTSPDVVIRDLAIRGSGTRLDQMDAAVFLEQSAARAIVENNDIEGNLVGVYVHGPADAVVKGNKIVGRTLGP